MLEKLQFLLFRYQSSFRTYLSQDKLISLTQSLEQNDDGQNKFEKTFKLTSKINTSNMVLYDRNGYLKKYTSPLEIIDDYFEVRMEYYVKRKEYQLNALERELKIVNARVKFIEEFIAGTIQISNKTKKDILEQLETKEYPKIDDCYDYLIKMPIYNLTKERIEELKKDRDTKMSDFTNLKNTTEVEIYMGELKELEKMYGEYEIKKEQESESGTVKSGKKKIIKKKK